MIFNLQPIPHYNIEGFNLIMYENLTFNNIYESLHSSS